MPFILSPTKQRNDAYLFGAWKVLQDLAVLAVLDSDLDLRKAIKDVQLGEGDCGVAVYLRIN